MLQELFVQLRFLGPGVKDLLFGLSVPMHWSFLPVVEIPVGPVRRYDR